MGDQVPDGLVGRVARGAAERLGVEGLVEEVEAIVQGGGGERRADQYLDPVSLASLVVSVASLGWTIYSDLRRKGVKAAPEVVARQIRVRLPGDGAERDRVVEVVVDEIEGMGD